MSAAVGDVITIELDRPAHGGFAVGRSDGMVVFVRHALPGEQVRAEITSIGSGGRFLRADAVEVLRASALRVQPECPHAIPGGCGGCDWQHATLDAQRDMKAEIIREQLVRVGRLTQDDPLVAGLAVASCGNDDTGFGYRTRMDFVADPRGRLGLRASRSHDVVALRGCPLATAAVNDSEALRQPWAAGATIRVTEAADGVHVTPEGADAATVRQRVGDTWFDVAADGFWQVHRNAPLVFTDLARELLQPKAGEFLLDLYGGVGLFARILGAEVGAGGRVTLVESDRRAGRLARRNLRTLPNADVVVERVDRWLAARQLSRVDVVVLDPPRAGAGKAVMTEIARLRPRAILYVACDPASLARDIHTAGELGYRLADIRAVDAFPQTAHVETFALLIPE